MRVNDAITGAVLVIFALAEIAYTRTFPSLHGQSYGPNLFPTLIGLGLIACGSVLILRGLLARRANAREPTSAENSSALVSWIDFGNMAQSTHARVTAVLAILSLLLYIFLSEWIGFIPLSLAIIGILLYRMGSSLLASCVIAIIATIAIQILFARVLLVPLPAGWLQGLVW